MKMSKEAIKNMNELDAKIEQIVKYIKSLEEENENLREARMKQAEYIGTLHDYLFMQADTKSNFKEWFKKFDKEIKLFYEARNNKCAADNPDCNSLHPGDVVLQSGRTAAGTDKVHECRA